MEDFMSRKDSAEAERRWLREQEKFPWRKKDIKYRKKRLRPGKKEHVRRSDGHIEEYKLGIGEGSKSRGKSSTPAYRRREEQNEELDNWEHDLLRPLYDEIEEYKELKKTRGDMGLKDREWDHFKELEKKYDEMVERFHDMLDSPKAGKKSTRKKDKSRRRKKDKSRRRKKDKSRRRKKDKSRRRKSSKKAGQSPERELVKITPPSPIRPKTGPKKKNKKNSDPVFVE